MGKYRVNGKFATFKAYVKAYGLDNPVISYDRLNTQEKRIYNGIKTAQNRLTAPNGRFVEENILKRDIIVKAAKINNLTPREYWNRDKELITRTFEKGLPMSKNSFKMAEFVEKHNGKFTYKGKPISKKALLYKVAQKEQGHKTKARKASESEDNEDSDTDFILIYQMRHNVLTNEIELYEINSLKDMR